MFHVQVTENTKRNSGWLLAPEASGAACLLAGRGKAVVGQKHRAVSLSRRREDAVLFSKHLFPPPKIPSPVMHKVYQSPDGKHGHTSMISFSFNPKTSLQSLSFGELLALSDMLCSLLA